MNELIKIKELSVNGKKLQLKIINQLSPVPVSSINPSDFNCLGYYRIKNQKVYIFTNGIELFSFDNSKDWGHYSHSKNTLGYKNSFKKFNSEQEAVDYLKNFKDVKNKILEEQLFY